MATELKNIRLYTVRTAENVYHSGIEASTANEAIEIATRHGKDKTIYDATCQKIYEGSIGTETVGETSKRSNDIFEIRIRGTNAKVVDKLKELLAKFINGPMVSFEYGDNDEDRKDAARNLAYEIDNLGLTVESL